MGRPTTTVSIPCSKARAAVATPYGPAPITTREVLSTRTPYESMGGRAKVTALEEWHRRIPDYAIADCAEVTFHVGGVAGVDNLPLVWSVD
jgi:hypothetical protein